MSYNLYELNQRGLPRLLEGVKNVEDWKVKRSGIRRQWLEVIGGVPERAPVSWNVWSEEKERDHMRIHLAYSTAYGDTVPAYLLVPDDTVAGQDEAGRRPAVLALHPTHESGKANVSLSTGRDNRRYGLELVSQGYIVLAPDALTAGERIYEGLPGFHSDPFYERHPTWSTVGKNAVDHQYGIDLLCSLDGVAADKIGVIGHSFGGYNAYFLAGLDDRIQAVVSSCGFSPFYGDHRPTHWGERDWYTHLPAITDYLSRYEVPFEFHEIAALAAPIPSFHYFGQSDTIFPHWKAIGECMEELYGLYRFLDADDCFQSVMTVREHDFPPDIRSMAYRFLDRFLKTGHV
ncbi:dienelactone hydrolase family protein [Paenibacillus hodogayensis]|uniref:Dienelactone hydrolase family protein n=1 Tax=Paenibacillus hodogayensis TaxID=279208 RepID=A0ABV5W8E0_9BACL